MIAAINKIISNASDLIEKQAFKAKIYENLKSVGFDKTMMEYYTNICNGTAFGAMSILGDIIGDSVENIYNSGVENAMEEISTSNKFDYKEKCVYLLDLLDFDGEEYYNFVMNTDRETKHTIEIPVRNELNESYDIISYERVIEGS